MKAKSWITVGIVIASLTIGLTSLWAAERGTLTISSQWDVESMDVHQVGIVESVNIIGSLYDTLVTFDKEGELAPCLATSWEVSEDGKMITFHLREGVKFHDGKELTADDVKFSFERLLRTSKKTPSKKLSKMTSVDNLIAADKYTFVMKLEKPSPTIFGILTNPMCLGIVGRDYVKENALEGDPYAITWMRTHENGTGPWKLEKWAPNEKVILVRNDDYWGEKPHFERLTWNVIKDPATAQMMLEKGDLDIALRLRMDQYLALEKVKGVKVVSHPTLKTVYLQINCSKEPLDDVRVRKALNYAINYDELIKYVEMGKVTRLFGTCPIGILGHNPDVTPKYAYDPEKAKSLLKEAGVSEGLEVTLLTSVSRHAPFEDMLPYIVSYLKDIGIEAKAQKLSFSTQYAKMMKKDFDLALNCWNPYNPDPSETSLAYYQSYRWKQGFGWSFAFYENKELDELLAAAEENMDRKERAQQYRKADQITVETAAAAPLYQTHETIAMRDDIKGLDWHSTLWYKGFKSLYR